MRVILVLKVNLIFQPWDFIFTEPPRPRFPLELGSFGALATLLFGLPHAPASQPRAIFYGGFLVSLSIARTEDGTNLKFVTLMTNQGVLCVFLHAAFDSFHFPSHLLWLCRCLSVGGPCVRSLVPDSCGRVCE